MTEEYTPIKTKADRRREMPGKAWDFAKRIANSRFVREVGETFVRKVQQGADEFVNMLYSGSAYLPWPGAGQPPREQETATVHGAPAREPVAIQAGPPDLSGLTGGKPRREAHASLYVAGDEPAAVRSAEQSITAPVTDTWPRYANHNDLYVSSGPADYARSQPSQSLALER